VKVSQRSIETEALPVRIRQIRVSVTRIAKPNRLIVLRGAGNDQPVTTGTKIRNVCLESDTPRSDEGDERRTRALFNTRMSDARYQLLKILLALSGEMQRFAW